jgi:hypothetical protein
MATKLVKAERYGHPAYAVEEDGVRLGYVYKSVEETHVMANDRGLNYSIGTRRRNVYRADVPGKRGLVGLCWRTRAEAVAYIVRYFGLLRTV